MDYSVGPLSIRKTTEKSCDNFSIYPRACHMIEIIGPAGEFSSLPSQHAGITTLIATPLAIEASTLTEALAAYTARYGCRFELYDGALEVMRFKEEEVLKYFVYIDSLGVSALVDIHVERAGEELFPKHDLTFQLQHGDRILIGELVC